MYHNFSSRYRLQYTQDGVCGGYIQTGITYTSGCANKNLPGVDRIWLGSLDTISAITVSSTNVITGITMSGTAKLYRFLVAPYSASVDEPATIDTAKLVSYLSPLLNMALGKKQTSTRNIIEDMRSAKVAGVYKDLNGIYWAFGLNSIDGVSVGVGADILSLSGPSGKAKTDDAGYFLSIGYDSTYLMREVSAAAVAAVVNTL